jgi:hypothetical protein
LTVQAGCPKHPAAWSASKSIEIAPSGRVAPAAHAVIKPAAARTARTIERRDMKVSFIYCRRHAIPARLAPIPTPVSRQSVHHASRQAHDNERSAACPGELCEATC